MQIGGGRNDDVSPRRQLTYSTLVPSALRQKPISIYTTKVYHMAVSTNSPANQTAGVERSIRKCAGGEALQFEGDVKGVDRGITDSVVLQSNLLQATAHTATISQRFILTLSSYLCSYHHTRSRPTKYSNRNFVKISSFVSELLSQVGKLCRANVASCTAGSAAS